MPDKTLFNAAMDRELEVLEIYLYGKSMRTAITLEEYIGVRLTSGASKAIIKKELLLDLETGGRIFGEFRSGIQATAKGNLHRMRDASQVSDIGVENPYRWVAVLKNTCPDCLQRHNNVATWDQWETQGLPRTGATVCRENCKCVLLPAETTETEPIKRGK